MFQYLITVSPLGFMYGSAGAFLSPENLVGLSGAKFPPDAATLSGLFFSVNHATGESIDRHADLTQKLHIAGPFWAKRDQPQSFYVPISRHRIIGTEDQDEWQLKDHQWHRSEAKQDVTPAYFWQSIESWTRKTSEIHQERHAGTVETTPWQYVSFLHPRMKADERHVQDRDGLFLENAVQLHEDYCLVYLSTEAIPAGWYRLGGEAHLVEINSEPIPADSAIAQLMRHPIDRACALITPGVWGSNKLSYRYPKHPEFPREDLKLLTDKALPYRYRIGNRETGRGRLGRGRYAVPAGSVYVFKQPLGKTWWDFPAEWFPESGLLKKLGSGFCLPVDIQIDIQADIQADIQGAA